MRIATWHSGSRMQRGIPHPPRATGPPKTSPPGLDVPGGGAMGVESLVLRVPIWHCMLQAQKRSSNPVRDRASPQMGNDRDGRQYKYVPTDGSRWRGSDSDSVPNPKLEFGSFRGPRNRIWFGFSTQELDSVRFARPRGRARFGFLFPGSDSARMPVQFGLCIRTRGLFLIGM